MSELYSFRCPTEVIYGFKSVEKLGDVLVDLGATRVLLVTDRGVREAGILDLVASHIKKAGVSFSVFEEVEPNPSVETVEKAYEVFREGECQAVVAVGGGSPLDVGKAVGILGANGGSILDYEGVEKARNASVPVVAIPTTAGTGSEVTVYLVITDQKRKYKFTIVSKKAAARVAILDPLLTASMPMPLTASTGMDALVHAIESYTSLMSNPISESLAIKAIRLISANLRQAAYNGRDLAARDAMLMGSLLAGMAFNNTRLGNAHAMSHPVSAYFGVPHGVANAVLIPYVMEFNLPAVPQKFAEIAGAMGCRADGSSLMGAAKQAVSAVWELVEDLGLPRRLSEVGVKEEAIEAMTDDAMKSGNVLVNPRTTTREDILQIYRRAL